MDVRILWLAGVAHNKSLYSFSSFPASLLSLTSVLRRHIPKYTIHVEVFAWSSVLGKTQT